MKSTVFFFFVIILATIVQANSNQAVITGTVIDSVLDMRVEYANVVLLEQESRQQITGTTSNKDGVFQLASITPGNYMLSVKFMGYHEATLRNIEIDAQTPQVDIGPVFLEPAIIMLEGVEATAERAAIEYQIDKKVVNVSKQYTAAAGSAVDVLENVPSVTVDIEGNVALRGSSGFRVLIDGRPSILESNDALKQIPASSIENIEIITNPSAKYDPDGTSGIINIVTKKNSMNGINGIVNLNAGMHDKYGGDVLLNYRTASMNIYVGADYNQGFYPGSSTERNITFLQDTTSYIESTGNSERGYTNYGWRAGFDWNMSERDVLGIGIRWGDRTYERSEELDYEEWREPGNVRNQFISLNEMKRGGDNGTATLNYKREFETVGHELTAEVDYRFRNGDDISKDELLDAQRAITSGRRSTEQGPGARLRTKIDYTLPLGEDNRFETGYQSRFGNSIDKTDLFEFNPETGQYEGRPEFTNETEYSREIHSLYALYASTVGALGLQGGLRGEYTSRSVESLGIDQTASLARWDYFPTAHLSLDITEKQQMMASYSRRIDRPRGYYFEPFLTWMDAYNVRRGNPSIEPEYIDSYEMGFQRNFSKNLVSLEGYYRVTHNKIERVRSVYTENIMLHSVENVGKDYTLGAELMINMDALSWWNVNMMGNLYDYRIEGVIDDEAFLRSSFSWDARLNNTFKFTESLRMQFNVSYNSPTVSAQGRREGYFNTNLAVRQSFLNDHLELILQARDLLSTAKYEYSSEGRDFYRKSQFTRESPIFTLTVNYLINNYKRERGGMGSNGGGMGFDEM